MSQTHRLRRFILISLVPQQIKKEEALEELEELKSLVNTFGGSTIVRVIQRRAAPDSGSYIGQGKVQEVATMIREDKIDIVVVNAVVKATQLFAMKEIFWKSNPDIEVWDRIDLILHIFSKHARTAEAQLEIELARMRHMGPRIYGLGLSMSQQGGGIGTRGLGETNVELMKRHWRNEMKKKQDRLDKLAEDREQKMARRREIGYKTVSIVGYTNAGKTSLFNRLSKKKKQVQDAMFVTLDSSVGSLYLQRAKKEILVSDTIGFIQNLPASLVNAFKSTLMESIHADLLLHVIDVADPKMYEKIAVVEEILHELKIEEKQRIYVFNKTDRAAHINTTRIRDLYADYNPQFISVTNGEGIDKLVDAIEEQIIHGYTAKKQDKTVEAVDGSKLNFAYASILHAMETSKTHEFPHNLGLLFLIENYLSFFLMKLIIDGLHGERHFHKASQFEKKTSQKMTLGQLYDMAKKYLEDEELKLKLERILADRNKLTHRLLQAASHSGEIEREAKELIHNIYLSFWEMRKHLYPLH